MSEAFAIVVLPAEVFQGLEDAVRKTWLQAEYYKIVIHVVWSTLVQSVSTYIFVPAISVEAVSSLEERAKAKQWVALVQEQHVSAILAMVESEYANFRAGPPPWALCILEEHVKQNWMQCEYFNIVGRIVDNTCKVEEGSGGPPKKKARADVVDNYQGCRN